MTQIIYDRNSNADMHEEVHTFDMRHKSNVFMNDIVALTFEYLFVCIVDRLLELMHTAVFVCIYHFMEQKYESFHSKSSR